MTYGQKRNAVESRFREIGIPSIDIESIYPLLDRLTLRPEGEPDTADLVGRINEICDRAGISDGEAAWRVSVMAEMLADARAELAQLDAETGRLDVLPPTAFIEYLRSLGVVGDVTVRVTH